MCGLEVSSGWQAWAVVAGGLCAVLFAATGFMALMERRYQRSDYRRDVLRRAGEWRPPEAREEVEE